MGDDGIGEITASLQLQQPRPEGGAIETDLAGLDQGPDGRADRGHREGRQAAQRPDERSKSEACKRTWAFPTSSAPDFCILMLEGNRYATEEGAEAAESSSGVLVNINSTLLSSLDPS
jgi:hypothetical protein